MLTRRLVVQFALGAVVMAASARDAMGTPYGAIALTVELGPWMSAERYVIHAAPGYRLAETFGWRVNGFAPPPSGQTANMFASARGGRIVAALPAGPMFSDDRGLHWYPARWDGRHQPLSIAFDTGSDFGAAVGDGGSLWVSDDRGETWRLRRDDAGQMLVDVAVAGTTIAVADANGGVWVSLDGGTSVRTLADRATTTMPLLQAHDHAVWVLVGGRVWWRAGDGSVERIESATPPAR